MERNSRKQKYNSERNLTSIDNNKTNRKINKIPFKELLNYRGTTVLKLAIHLHKIIRNEHIIN